MKMTEAQVRKHMNHKYSQREGLDPLDLEAEREGNARRFFKTNDIGPEQLGRRISRETRKHEGAAKTAELLGACHMVQDTRSAMKKYMVH